MKRIAYMGILLASLVAAACEPVDVGSTAGTGQTLCLADYQQCVDPVFHTAMNSSQGPATCSASGCHDQGAGSGGGFKIFPDPDPLSSDYDAQILANFTSAKAFANFNAPADSKLLLEPLEGSHSITGVHTGGDIFPDSNDVCYQAILAWINQPVDDREHAVCGACAPPDLNNCGF